MTGRVPAFVLVGAAGFTVQVTVLHLLVSRWHVPYALATVLAVESAVLGNFLWHERWTWQDRPVAAGGRVARLLRYHAGTGFVSIVGNVLVTVVMVEHMGMPTLAANTLAVVVTSAANFRIADRWVFRQRRSARRSTSSAARTKDPVERAAQDFGARTSTSEDWRPARIQAANVGAPAVSPWMQRESMSSWMSEPSTASTVRSTAICSARVTTSSMPVTTAPGCVRGTRRPSAW